MPRWTRDDLKSFEQRNGKKDVLLPSVPVAASLTIQPSTDEAKLNKTERAYHEFLKTLGDSWIGVQNITLKIANDCRLTPDFVAINHRGEIRFIDVKGFQREDALIKMKVAARMFPWANFVIVKRINGNWEHQTVKP